MLALATWRLSYLLVREDGPYNITKRLRALFSLGGLLDCIYCVSVWAALLMYGLLPTPAAPVVYVLAISGAAMLMHRYTGGNHT